ncbi:somatostatin receptor type 3 [Chanos chanos]|uniref:Somatostatin receptor type 3 n=1 Tax=Chanos chanos TaxID=29144 RepID=A0A6J2W3P2_CHACN|nr:somatostatin receptor type 3 [Chanos chanos]
MELSHSPQAGGFATESSILWSSISTLTVNTVSPSHLPPRNDSFLDEPSHNLGETESVGYVPSVTGILIPLIYIIVCIVGLGGNTLVIHIVLHYSQTVSVTNIYILNLAIADELFMLGLPFLAVQNALLSWPFGSLMCRLVMTVDAINQFTSIFCLTVMSIDRYLAVVHPIRSSSWRQPRVAKVVNVTVWVVSFIVVLPVVIFADVLQDDGNCSIVWPEPAEVWKAAFIVYTATVGFFGPLLVICLCYLLIVVKIRSAGRRVRATSIRRRKSERKITRMVVIVVAVFVLCWLPFYILNIVNLLVLLPREFRGLYIFVVVLSYANSCANPIIYGFLSDNFKRGFRKALCRSSRRVESQDHRQTGMHPQQKDDVGRQQEAKDCLTGTVVGVRDGEIEEEEEGEQYMEETMEDATQMMEICRITHNGCENGQPESLQKQLSQKGKDETAGQSHGIQTCEISGAGPSIGPTAVLNGAKKGNFKPRLEESRKNTATLDISCL